MRADRALVCVAMLMLVATRAIAEPTANERAAESFQQARAAFGRREFTAAAAAFEQAAEYAPHPVAWLNAAEAWAKAEEPVKAATDCDRVLDDPTASAVHRKEAAARLEVLSRRVATLQIWGEGRASLDGGAPFSLPSRRRSAAGPHVVSFMDSQRRVDVTARTGEVTEVALERAPASAAPVRVAPPAPAPAPAPALVPLPAHSRSIPVVSIVAFGAAALGAGATTFFALRTSSARDDFDTTPTAATRDSFYGARLATNVALGASVLALGLGVAFWLFSPSEPQLAAHIEAGGIAF